MGTPQFGGSPAPVPPASWDPAAVNLLLEMGPFPIAPPVLQGPMAPSPLSCPEGEPWVSAVCSAAEQQPYHQLLLQRPLVLTDFLALQTRHCVRTPAPVELLQCLRHHPHLVAASRGDAGILSLVLQV